MPPYVLWAGAAGLALGLLTWLVVRAWERRISAELDLERSAQAALQAERDAREADRRNAEAQRLILLHEVNHRARNALTVAQSLVRLTHSGEPGRGRDITARIAALAGAHDLLAENEWEGAELRQIAARTLAPFAGPSVMLAGGTMTVGAAAVQPLSMILHELATNAAKHGALSAGGRVELSWRRTATALAMTWTESGGPCASAGPARQGVGTRLLETLVCQQLGGRLRREWRPEGLEAEIEVPLARVAMAATQPAATRAQER